MYYVIKYDKTYCLDSLHRFSLEEREITEKLNPRGLPGSFIPFDKSRSTAITTSFLRPLNQI